MIMNVYRGRVGFVGPKSCVVLDGERRDLVWESVEDGEEVASVSTHVHSQSPAKRTGLSFGGLVEHGILVCSFVRSY
jgi:hypothetical protein